MTSALSQQRTMSLLAGAGLQAEVVAWELQDLPADYRAQREHLAQVERLSDAYTLRLGDHDALVCYLLEIRRADESRR